MCVTTQRFQHGSDTSVQAVLNFCGLEFWIWNCWNISLQNVKYRRYIPTASILV